MKFVIVLLSILFLFNVTAQESCEKFGPNHVCVMIDYCPPFIKILKGPKPIPESIFITLRTHHCGFDEYKHKIPKICCPTNIQEESTTSIIPKKFTSAPTGITPNPPDVLEHPNFHLLDHENCGPLGDVKIIGGSKTGVLDFPWMALIAYNVQGAKEFRCGGSIINKRYILTAAHCVTNLPEDISLSGVRVGEHDYSTERDCDRDDDGFEIVCTDGYQDFKIESYNFHPNYTKLTVHNDIALIRVDADIDFNAINVKPICLPIGNATELLYKKVTVAGWGATEKNLDNSPDLLMVNLSPVTNEDCAKAYRRHKPIWYKQLCAGARQGKDSCIGDSGGPLLAPAMYFNDPRYVQYGIVSYGPRTCGTKGIPGVYTRVSYYVDWILNHMKD